MIGIIASATAKSVFGTIFKTIGIGTLGGAAFYGGVKGAKEIDKIIQKKKAEKAMSEEETVEEPIAEEEVPVEETTEATEEETVTEEASEPADEAEATSEEEDA